MDAEQIEVALFRLYRDRFANMRGFRKFFLKPCWTDEMRPVICWTMAPIVGIVEHALGRALGEVLEPGARGVAQHSGTAEQKEGGGSTDITTPSVANPTGHAEWL